MKLFLLVVAVLLAVLVEAVLSDDPVIKTKLGAIRGVAQDFYGRPVSAFLGVPYAEPPVGGLRFAKPKKIQPWEGEFDARKPARPCFLAIDKTYPGFPGAEMWNPKNKMTEDCLNMNIWVPENHDGSVLVWIFGGGFFSGSPSLDLYNGTTLAAYKQTIVVNINYRLGPFGFLYLGADSKVPGNMGLLDQQMALQWVHENIDAFGGDPSKVTLFGESAGAASATAHMIAPGSYKFFSKIIACSGTIMNTWATRTPDEMLELSMRFAERLNCTKKGKDPMTIHKCLRNISPSKIQEVTEVVSYENILPMTFAFVPVSSDKLFFKGDLFDRLKNKEFKKNVAIIFGTVKDEGTYWLPYYLSDHGFVFNHTIPAEDKRNQALITREQYQDSMREFMPYFGKSPKAEKLLLRTYENVSERKEQSEKLRDGVGRFLGDYFFTCDLIDFADIVTDYVSGPVYMYYFTMRSTVNPWPQWMGVMHGYEIEYAFGQPMSKRSLYDRKHLEDEQSFSKYIMKLWKEFATTKIPAKNWPKYNSKKREALVLGEDSLNGKYNIMVDVHGPQCKDIKEAKKLAP